MNEQNENTCQNLKNFIPRTSTAVSLYYPSFEVKTEYDEWARDLFIYRTNKFKVRGLKETPSYFLSGHIVMGSFSTTSYLENISKPNKDLEKRITPDEYEEQIIARNNSILEKIMPILEKGLQKMILKNKKFIQKIISKECKSVSVEAKK